MEADRAIHTYRMSKWRRISLISMFAIALVAFISLILTLDNLSEDLSDAVSMTVYVSMIGSLVPLAITLYRFSRPMYQLSDEHLIVMGKKHRWDALDKAEMNSMNVFGNKNRVVIITKKKKGLLSLVSLRIGLSLVENSDDLFMRLRQRFPDLEYGEAAHMLRHDELAGRIRYPRPSVNVRYREFIFSPSGMQVEGRRIPWENILRAEGQKDVIAGYGRTTLSYREGEGIVTRIIKPQRSRAYHAAVLYVLHYASAARLDTGLVDMIDYPPGEALADNISLALILSGALLSLPSMAITTKYLEKGLSEALPIIAIVAPIGAAILAALLLMARKKRISIPSPVSIGAALCSPAIAVGCLAWFLTTTPVAIPLMAADLHRLKGNNAAAEAAYQRALKTDPESMNANYEAGHYYYINERFEEALPHMLKAYEADRDSWSVTFMEDIARAYERLGRHEEALGWCNKVMEDLQDKSHVVRRMEKLKENLGSEGT